VLVELFPDGRHGMHRARPRLPGASHPMRIQSLVPELREDGGDVWRGWSVARRDNVSLVPGSVPKRLSEIG
jgi:hypothetical protein